MRSWIRSNDIVYILVFCRALFPYENDNWTTFDDFIDGSGLAKTVSQQNVVVLIAEFVFSRIIESIINVEIV